MKLREYIKAGIGFSIGMTIVSTIVAFVNFTVNNELKRIQSELNEKTDSDGKTEEAE